MHDEDLIMISDIDEIPDLKKLEEFNIKNKFAFFYKKIFNVKINLQNLRVKVIGLELKYEKKIFKISSMVKKLKLKKTLFGDFLIKNIQQIIKGGWHFSFYKKSTNSIKK